MIGHNERCDWVDGGEKGAAEAKAHGLQAYKCDFGWGFSNAIEEHEPIAVPVPDKAGKLLSAAPPWR
jgi:hypothetical protein